jgi:mannose-6-phosphate isomerase
VPLEDLVMRLNDQFPGGDVGVLAPLLLNYFTLKPGEATFLGPNQPHAYLSGDCVECMSCSDNTIRAGLTPKFKDVEVLCSTLTYQMSPPPYFKSTEVGPGVDEYAPPVPEFAVHRLTNKAKALSSIKSSSIFIVVEGKATLKAVSVPDMKVTKGDVVFTAAKLSEISIDASEDFLAFRAFTPPTN